MKNGLYLVVSDAHVSSWYHNESVFFDMLQAIKETELNVVFLGDIFDLWIGVPRYETSAQKAFLVWCEEQKGVREIGFIEGNHEFFVHHYHRDVFSWSDSKQHIVGRVVFAHGDLANPKDINYLRFRRWTNNDFTRNLIRWMPWGPTITQRLKRKLEGSNKPFKLTFPAEEIGGYGSELAGASHDLVVIGHFHRETIIDMDSGKLFVAPDWWSTGRVALLEIQSGDIEVGPWQELLSAHKMP
ncbi:MAG: metallophosphoesterase [Acidobacteria bacterium]|nr:metallophosphoesterase [Acidobacteriota bacterium]